MNPAPPRAAAASERTILVATAAVLLAVWTIVGFAIHQAREAALREARLNGANLTAALSEEVARTFDAISEMMDSVARRIRAGEGIDIYRWAQRIPIISGGVIQAGFIDAKGNLVATTRDPSAAPTVLSDRPDFRVHLDGTIKGLFIGSPVNDPISSFATIEVTKRVDAPDGKFLGVLMFTLAPSAFGNLYRHVDLGQHGTLAVTGSDGIVRARFSKSSPEGLDGVGRSVAAGPHASEGSGAVADTYLRESILDHVTRVYTFRAVPRYPLEVTVGFDAADVFASHDRDAVTIISLTVIASLALCGFAVYLIRVGRTTTRYQAELASEQAKAREAQSERERAEAASQAKSLFLTNMSHELRTPLNAIIGFSEIIKDQALGPSAGKNYADYAKDIHNSGQHLLSLINDMLDLTKIDAGQMALDEEPIDLGELATQSLSVLGPQSRSKGVSVESDIPRDLPFILGDRQKLRRALLNLIGNAIKFNRQGGRVAIRTKPEPAGGLSVEIADTGIGMTGDEIAMALEAFVQVDSSLNRRYQGTGIGLPLTKRLIELHGCTLTIESVKGAGTTVVLGFPAHRVVARESVLRPSPQPFAAA